MITWFTDHDTDCEMPIDELAAHILLVNYLSVRPMVKVWVVVLYVSLAHTIPRLDHESGTSSPRQKS